MADNIIDLEAIKRKREEALFDSLVEESILEEEAIHVFAANAVMDIIEVAADMGYDPLTNPECVSDIILIFEGIRGYIHRISNSSLAIHRVADKAFKIEDHNKVLKEFMEHLSKMS